MVAQFDSNFAELPNSTNQFHLYILYLNFILLYLLFSYFYFIRFFCQCLFYGEEKIFALDFHALRDLQTFDFSSHRSLDDHFHLHCREDNERSSFFNLITLFYSDINNCSRHR